MLGKAFVFLSLLLLTAGDASVAQSAAPRSQWGTWSAITSSGVTFRGTWTGVPDSTGTAVVGTWTLVDAADKKLAEGTWSAAKSSTSWAGAWRALVAGRSGEYSGTWTSSVDLKGDARFVDLFAKAADTIVSGTWRYGSQSGAWSIRAARAKENPESAASLSSSIVDRKRPRALRL